MAGLELRGAYGACPHSRSTSRSRSRTVGATAASRKGLVHLKRFWDQKVPVVTLVLFAILDITAFIGVSEGSVFGYWPPMILLVALVLQVWNSIRIDRARKHARVI